MAGGTNLNLRVMESPINNVLFNPAGGGGGGSWANRTNSGASKG